ncbi:MAG: hypothetical protein HZB81_03895 [Deltaproteobacteria bacterium]|nr:hypothetical protein [Deltaproteobacteria bacterium]
MKKILIAVFAVLVTAAWVLPAMAVDTTFYGTYRVRLFSTNNAADYNSSGDTKLYSGTGSTVTTTAGANPTDNNSWIDQRFRLMVESKASDNLRGFVQLQIGNFTGGNGSHIWGTTASATNMEIYVRQAYLSFNAGPVRIKAGRSLFGDAPDGGGSFKPSDDNQYWGLLDGGLIVVAQVDGFLLATQKNLDPVNLAFGYVKLSEASSTSTTTGASDKDNTLYVMQALVIPSDTLTAGGYFLYDRDRTTIVQSSTVKSTNSTGQNSPWWLGGGAVAKLDPISLKVHAAYKGGKYEKGCQPGSCGIAATGTATDLKYSAYALDADVSAKVGPATVGFAAGMGSGDKSTQDTKSKAFSGVAPAYGVQLGARPAIFFDGGDVSNGGATLNTTYSNGIGTSASGSTQSTLGNITFAETEKKNTTSATNTNTWESKLGYEIHLTAVYKLYKALAIVGQAAWFLPGEGIRTYKSTAGNNASGSLASDDAVSEYYAKIQYDF